MEHMSKTSADVSEVVFDQPEEKAGAMEPDGSVLNRHKEEEWLEDMEPYHGARPRTTEFDRPVDEVLGATSGGKEENVKLRDIVVPSLHPEQQIRQEEEVQTPPRREPRRNEGHQPTYVVKQPDYETEPVRVVTVNKPNSSVDQSEELLKKLLAVLTPTVPPPARAPELSLMEKLVQLLLLETAKREPAPPMPAEPPGLKTLLQTYFAEQQSPRQGLRFRQVRRNWSDVKCFSCGKTGHSATRCPTLDVTFPFILPGWKAEKTLTGYLMISPKMATDRAENED